MLAKAQLKSIFPDWEEGLYEAIIENAELKEASAGTILLKPGQNIKSAMLVIEGTVKLYQEDEDGGIFYVSLKPWRSLCSYFSLQLSP